MWAPVAPVPDRPGVTADKGTVDSGLEAARQAQRVQVTLITGDVVTVMISSNGTRSFAISPADPARLGQRFMTLEKNGDTYIYPDGVDLQKLDMELFDIDYLVTEQYYQQPSLPVIVSYSPGMPPARVQSLAGAITALGQETKLQKEVGAISTRLAYQGITPSYSALLSQPEVSKVWLDKKVHALLNDSVPIIGAPSLWASGYNGTGVKIAILDTGIDSSRPGLNDLDDNPATNDPKVIVNTNYTDDTGFNDLYGHGTHVAGIAAGTSGGVSQAHSGTHAWFSGADNNLRNTLTRSVDLTSVSSANLTFWTMYDIEQNYDYGYLKVSTDNGTNWTTLATYSGPSANQSSFTMLSYNISAYAGRKILLRFEYVTDYVVVRRGWYIDDIAVAGIGFTDDVESGAGNWTAVGWTVAEMVYRGVAPGAWLWNVKVLNQYGYGYESWIINGINFASLGQDGVAGTGDEANIISMSLGGGVTDGTDPLSQAVNLAVDRGVTVIIAAGNSGSGMTTVSSPGAAEKVITVGASDKKDTLAYFSSRGPTPDGRIKPDILAHGVDIISSVPTNPSVVINDPSGYRKLSGTSMATPHVAGAAALLRQYYGAGATPQFIKDTLMSNSKDLGYDVYKQGAGRLDLTRSLSQKVGVTPASLSLGRFTAANTTAGANFTFSNSDNVSHQVSLSANLTDVYSGDNYAIGSPQMQWQKTFGGTNEDGGFSVQQTAEGGYVTIGWTYSLGAGSYDVYLVKTDASGNMTWQKTFGGANDDYGYAVRQTMDGGYIIAGMTYSFGAGIADVYLVKTDASGNMTWQKTFGGTGYDLGYSVRQTTDGGYIIAGLTYSSGAGSGDVYLIKTDASGNLLWSKTFGGTNSEFAYSVQQTSDAGYVITGYTYSFVPGGYDVYLVKTDASGNMLWQKTFGGANDDLGYSVQPTADGGYIITGYTVSFGTGGSDVYLVKTDASGNMTWQKTLGGTSSDYGYSVRQTADGGYVIAGYTYSFGAGGSDVYLVKTDASGTMLWQKTFGGTNSDYGGSVQPTADGGYIIAGETYSFGAGSGDVYLIKVKIATAGVTTLTPSTFTVPAHGQVQVNLNINLAALPASLYGGTVTANIDNTTAIHAIFGFSKMNQLTLHKTEINGAPAQGHPVWLLLQNPLPGLNQFYANTNQSGNATFYLPAGSYDLISPNWVSGRQLDIWTIAENVTVAGDMSINLDERDTKIVDFNPNKPGLTPAARTSNMLYRPTGNGWSSSWYYPQSFVARVSPISKFYAWFNYNAYPQTDFARDGAGLVNTGEWYNLLYSVEKITGNTTFTVNYTNLVHRNTAYGVALTGERANWYQYEFDNIARWSYVFQYQMDAPQQRWEWLSPQPAYYYQDYWKTNSWEFYKNSSSSYSPGNWNAAYGFHPFTSGIYQYVSYGSVNNYLYLGGPISRDSVGNSYYNQGGMVSHLKVTANNTGIILEKDIRDNFSEQVSFNGSANLTVEVWGQTPLALSRSSYTRLEFSANSTHDSRPPQLTSIIVPGIDASGIVPGGTVKVRVQAYDESLITSVRLRYSLTDNVTWLDAGLPTLEGGTYVFNLGSLQNTLVSLAVDATDSYGNHIYRSTNRAFYVANPPHITVSPSGIDVTLSPGGNTTRTITIGNTGQGDLIWQITSNLTSATSLTLNAAASVTRTALSPEETDANSIRSIASLVQAQAVTLPFTDGFEDGNYDGWVRDGSIGTAEVTSATAAVGTRSFHYTAGNYTGHSTGIHQEFAGSAQPEYVSFYVRAGGTTTHTGYFRLDAGTPSGFTQAIWFFATGDGRFYINGDVGGDNTYAYQPNVWYHVEFRDIDWQNKKFDYYVNGQLVKSDIPFRNASLVNYFGVLWLYNFSPLSDAWWDGIYIGESPGRWLSVASPRSGIVPPGGQVQIQVNINAAGFGAGEVHRGAINILHNDSQAAIPWTVPVTMTVTGASPPVITTNNATGITPVSATLNGRLSSLGAYSSANVSFAWGTASGNLTQLTPHQLMTSTGDFSSALSGLSGNTTYYFRARATANITVFGDEFSFRTSSLGVYVFINAPDRVVPGSNFTATVDISQVNDFDAASYVVSFNSAVLRLNNVTAGQIGAGGNFTSIPVDIWNATSNSTFNVIQNIPGLNGASGSGYLAVLHFQAVGSLSSSSNISLSGGVLSNNLAQGIPAIWIGDVVQVSLQPGDANGDGAVNAIDITKVERIIAHLDSSTPGGDANQDGNINSLDITKVERLIAGLD